MLVGVGVPGSYCTAYRLHLQIMGTVPIYVETSPSAPPMGGHWPHRAHKWPLLLPFGVRALAAKREQHAGALFSTAFLIYYILVQQVHGNRLSLASIIRAWRPTPTPPGLKHYQTQSNTPRLIPSFNLSQLFPRTLSQCSNSVFALSFGERHPAGGEVKRQAQGWGKVPKTGPCANPPSQNTPHHTTTLFFIVYSIPSATARCLPHVQPTFLSRRCRSRCSGECCPDCW